MCSQCLEQLLNQFKDQLFHQAPKEEPQFTELEIKQLKERHELVERQEREREEASLQPHQKEGWKESFKEINNPVRDLLKMAEAIVSLQAQIDELKL